MEKRERVRERYTVVEGRSHLWVLFVQAKRRKEGRRGGKASLKKRLRLGTHPNFFEHFVWVLSNPNLYKCDLNCFSSVCGCFEVV